MRPYERWSERIERHHRLILIASVVCCLASAVSLTRLRLDFDVLGMLPRGAPSFDAFKSFVADFGELNQLLIMVDGAPAPQLRRFSDVLAQKLRSLDTVGGVYAGVDVEAVRNGVLGRYLYNYLTEKDYAELRQRLTSAGIEAQVVADRAILSAPLDLSAVRAVLEDPLGIRRMAARSLSDSYGSIAPRLAGGYFASKDGSALLIVVRPTNSAFDTAFNQRLLAQVHAAADAAAATVGGQNVRVSYTGSYVYALEDAATLRSDVNRYILLALAGVLAVFYLGYRDLRILPFVTYPLVVTTLLTFGCSLLLFDQLNALSLSFAAILYGLSIDSGIHFYTRLLQERRARDLRGATAATLAALGRANLAASGSTAAVFCVIGFSCLSAVSQLGFLTAVGMGITMVEFFLLYPALGFLLGDRSSGAAMDLATPRLARLAGRSAAHARVLSVVSILIGGALCVAASHVRLDATLTHLRPSDSNAARVQDQIASRFGVDLGGAAVLVHGVGLQSALEAAERASRQLRAYEAEGLLRSVRGVGGILPSAEEQRRRLALYNRLPRAEALETLQVQLRRHGFRPERFADFFASFRPARHEIVLPGDPALAPLSLLVERHVREREGHCTVSTYVQPAAGVSLATVSKRLHRDLGGMSFTVASRTLLEEDLNAVLRREIIGFFLLSLLANLVLLVATFRRVGTAFAILWPEVLVLAALLGGMWVAGIALDPVNLIVVPLILGLGVDDGVYIAAEAQQRGDMQEGFCRGGRALVMTSMTTIVGFGFLGLSRFSALATMGSLAGLGLSLCLAFSIILLPALLTWSRRREDPLVHRGADERRSESRTGPAGGDMSAHDEE